jgi:hypothetical protein
VSEAASEERGAKGEGEKEENTEHRTPNAEHRMTESLGNLAQYSNLPVWFDEYRKS